MFSGSLKSRDRIRSWVRSCDIGHTCHQKTIPVLPTRVLDIGTQFTSGSVLLWETQGARGRYLALSHSWGKSKILTTKRQTLQNHKSGISISNLPPTFCEAVQIAAGLGIQYVWIDSLCIIQDDFADWEREAPKMAHIYNNAYLTVSASHALNPSEGCFPRARFFEYYPLDSYSLGAKDTWNYLNFVPVQVSLSFRRQSRLFFTKAWMPPSDVKNPKVYCNGNFGRKCDPIELEPLTSRGWTLQERLLSPRVLHFTREQMYWECKRCFVSEDGTRFDPKAFSLDSVLQSHKICPTEEIKADFMSFVPQTTLPPYEYGRWKGGWLSIVSDFSRRKLTYVEDKLPALSGLATLIASHTGDTYLCGLWKRHIFQDLCWKVDYSWETELVNKFRDIRWEPDTDINTPGLRKAGMVRKDYSHKIDVKRIPERAPSWSWASLEASIGFTPLQGDRIVAELVSYQVTPSGHDSFGRVASAWLVLNAPLLTMEQRDLKESTEWIRTAFDSKHPNETPVKVRKNNETAPGFAAFDIEGHFPCFALFLDSANALILRKFREGFEFQRIGVASFLPIPSQQNESHTMGSRGILHTSKKVAMGPIRANDLCSRVKIV